MINKHIKKRTCQYCGGTGKWLYKGWKMMACPACLLRRRRGF